MERSKPIPMDRLRKYLSKERLPILIKLQADQVGAFTEMAAEITRKATLEGWTRELYIQRIEGLADLFGANGFRSHYAEVWYRTYVQSAAYNEAQVEMLQRTKAGQLFPYLRLETQNDNKVRDEHQRLRGLTAVFNWKGWRLYTPPLGWNCRCFLVKISWKTARSLGLQGMIAKNVEAVAS